ncbi:methyltransferase domain-containing protein [Alteromonas sediminis]|uniref:tRNA 5-carboxymethoxyuridine methyltransferase n=1 Tax=Alteromonas sediminis TaxID=2259342 RepID=A0A3N5Y3U9_9ALTE|nr:methyltransferase domain-containing protein [Alteromonas sediminis]RPJ67556.1 methyltransferase domain-containing protein [Alteromonas sediminis]
MTNKKDIRQDIRRDQSFDGIADKFNKNIYGTPKGKLRHAILSHVLAPHFAHKTPLKVLDLGGGTGVMAQTFIEWGHKVDIVDISSDVLELAKASMNSAIDTGMVRFFCSPIQTFNSEEKYDLVICHAVLEWLAEPLKCMASLVRFLKPEGTLSLSFFNRDAKLFSNVVYGNFEYVENGLQVKNQVRLNPQSPLTLDEVSQSLSGIGFHCIQTSGIRCFYDYMKRPLVSEQEYQYLLALEKQYCQQAPFSLFGRYLHVLAKQPDEHHQAAP